MLPLSQMLAILCLEYLVVKVLQNQLMSLQKSSIELQQKHEQHSPIAKLGGGTNDE